MTKETFTKLFLKNKSFEILFLFYKEKGGYMNKIELQMGLQMVFNLPSLAKEIERYYLDKFNLTLLIEDDNVIKIY